MEAMNRKMCWKHYCRVRRYGDPTVVRKSGAALGTLEERFWAYVNKQSDGECWGWRLRRMRNGYGRIGITDPATRSVVNKYAHRLSWELNRGPIPEGYEVHHKCHNRMCVNPSHLEVLTVQDHRRSDMRERVECPHGHPYSPENTYMNPKGVKICRTCLRLGAKRRAAA